MKLTIAASIHFFLALAEANCKLIAHWDNNWYDGWGAKRRYSVGAQAEVGDSGLTTRKLLEAWVNIGNGR